MDLKLKRLWRGSAIAMLVLVLIASLLPQEHIPEGNDKLQHFMSYAILAGWWFLAFQARIPRDRAFIAVGLILFGGAVELLQGTTSYRFADFADVFANSAGIFLATVFLPMFLHNWLEKVDKRIAQAMKRLK